MKSLYALQHCDSEFLGLMEDHFEGRGIRFQYVRPFTADGKVPGTAFQADGLILLGGGAWGAVGAKRLPSLAAEIRLARDFLNRKRPVIGFGLGAQILCLAAGGGAEPVDLTVSVGEARKVAADGLNGFLPDRFPLIAFMRDRPIAPADARILAVDAAGRPAVFQIGANNLGFVGHPGYKPAMIEDLIMEFDDPIVDETGQPVEPAAALAHCRAVQNQIAAALVPIMTGMIQVTGLMQPLSDAELKRRQTIPIQR